MADAQLDLRRAHVDGAAGVLISGLVWLITGLVWLGSGPFQAFVVLFFGGMAISPVAQALSRLVFQAPASTVGKRLEWIAVATVPIVLGGFYVAWRGIDAAPTAAIAVVAISVGVRYLTFPIMFGRYVFVALGTAFILGGWFGYSGVSFSPLNIAVILGLTEFACAAWLYRQWHQSRATD